MTESNPETRCEVCGAELFAVVPGRTTEQAIRDFAANTPGWRENPEAVGGWMPSGVYCPNGCTHIHTTPIPPWAPDAERRAAPEPPASPEGERCPPELQKNARPPVGWIVGSLAVAVLAFFITQGQRAWEFLGQLVVLAFSVFLAQRVEAWLAREPEDAPFPLPVMGLLVVLCVGGALGWFFGWIPVLGLAAVYAALGAVAGLNLRND